MSKPFAVAGALALALMTSACVTVTAAPAGAYKVSDNYAVTLGGSWNDISAIMVARPSNVRLLSLDGPLLNRLYLTDGLAAGQFLVKPLAKELPTPTYRAGMSSTELIEFVTDSVAALDYQRVQTGTIAPGTFAGGEGLRIDLTAKTKEGLDMSGRAAVAERGGRLYVILYLAPTEHYYRAHLAEVNAIMDSARLAKS
jgi:hypothetical protein